MDTFYINLAAATERRRSIEENFRQFAPPGYQLVRVPAVDAERVKSMGLQGKLRPSEIACLKSHMNAILGSMSDSDHSLIVEDDALFGPSTFSELNRTGALDDDSVDLIYTSALLGNLNSLVELFQLRRSCIDRGESVTMDLAKIHFAGADAYLVKKNSKAKLLALLGEVRQFDVPYDILLRIWIREKKLNAVLLYPCVTSLAPSADESLNGNAAPLWLAWNTVRRLLARDAAHYPGKVLAAIETMDPSFVDVEADNMSRVLRLMLSKSFPAE